MLDDKPVFKLRQRPSCIRRKNRGEFQISVANGRTRIPCERAGILPHPRRRRVRLDMERD
jgi:hypothetical protein